MAISRRLFILFTAATLAASAGCASADKGSPRRVATVAEAVGLAGEAPAQPYAVGLRTVALQREGRPLPTMIWYPAAGPPGGGLSPRAEVAMGRFPLVLLSHGLGGNPEGFTDLATALAADGFVVVAPAYPYTKKGSAVDRNDVRHQPADGMHVLDAVAKLSYRMDDAFAGRLATSRMAAAGFSAGGTTTNGMFTHGRDSRLRCAVIIAGRAMEGGLSGDPAPVLFVHGDTDTVVAYSQGQAVYDRLTWPKALLTMKGQGHGEFLDGKRPGFPPARAVITDFLRWNLYGDNAARKRLLAEAGVAPVTSFDNRL